MLSKLKKIAGKTKEIISSTAVLVGDLNGDGKVDEEDARIAAEWAKKTATSISDEASKLGKQAIRSDLTKDAAAGAAIGAAVAIPVPVLGPMAGAAIGAGLGVYKNLTGKGQKSHLPEKQVDVHAELLKLHDLLMKNIISEAEYEAQKNKILAART
ncbi:MAG: hypothetical protein V1706_09250 [Pseudomonadota bacterium]